MQFNVSDLSANNELHIIEKIEIKDSKEIAVLFIVVLPSNFK